MPVIITEVAIQADGTFAVELFNNGPDDVDLTGEELSLQIPSAGSIFGIAFADNTMIDAGETLVVGHSSISAVDIAPADTIFDQTAFGATTAPSLTLVYLGDNTDTASATDHFGLLSGGTFTSDTVFESSPTRDPDPDVNNNNVGDFTSTSGFGNNTLGIPCFLTGTLIATPTGEMPVEDLQAGDLVLTEDGRAVSVLWLGQKHVRRRIGTEKEMFDLVCIEAGTIGNHSDLYVTADHGMVVEGYLINAGALVNGSTIKFVSMNDLKKGYTVYHVETENHDVVLANGAPSETFVDAVTRHHFDNFDEYVDLCGEERIIPESSMPRISARRMVPASVLRRLGIEQAVALDPVAVG